MYSVILISNIESEYNNYYYDFCNDGKYCYEEKFGVINSSSAYGTNENTYCPNGFLFRYGGGNGYIITDKDTITFTCNPSSVSSNFSPKIYPLVGGSSNETRYPFLKFPFARNFYEYQTVTEYPMNLEQIECLLKSLPDWYNDYNSHYISLNIRYSIQENEESDQRLQQLIQMANDKGWTVYENYN